MCGTLQFSTKMKKKTRKTKQNKTKKTETRAKVQSIVSASLRMARLSCTFFFQCLLFQHTLNTVCHSLPKRLGRKERVKLSLMERQISTRKSKLVLTHYELLMSCLLAKLSQKTRESPKSIIYFRV